MPAAAGRISVPWARGLRPPLGSLPAPLTPGSRPLTRFTPRPWPVQVSALWRPSRRDRAHALESLEAEAGAERPPPHPGDGGARGPDGTAAGPGAPLPAGVPTRRDRGRPRRPPD